MKVKVKKCSNPIWWYAGMIGQEFDVVNDLQSDYHVNFGAKDVSFLISKEDCEVIPDVVLAGTIGMETSKEPSGFKTIKMSLDTAREWYKLAKQNEFDTVQPAISWLLENFTKEELEPKKGFTWEDSFNGSGQFINPLSGKIEGLTIMQGNPSEKDRCLYKTTAQAESALAFAQLTHIVAKYNEGKSNEMCFYTVYKNANISSLCVCMDLQDYLGISFIDKSDAMLSMEVNKDLWKQYWMIK